VKQKQISCPLSLGKSKEQKNSDRVTQKLTHPLLYLGRNSEVVTQKQISCPPSLGKSKNRRDLLQEW